MVAMALVIGVVVFVVGGAIGFRLGRDDQMESFRLAEQFQDERTVNGYRVLVIRAHTYRELRRRADESDEKLEEIQCLLNGDDPDDDDE